MMNGSLFRTPSRGAIALAILVSASSPALASYSQAIFFGDSLSDTGNLYLATGIPAAPPYYKDVAYGGQFSNGPVWTQDFAAALGLSAQPYLQGGTNYAWAGATVLDYGRATPEIPQELGVYFSKTSGLADPNALYVILGGANDISDAMMGLPTNPAIGSADLKVKAAAASIDAMVQALYAAGARNILVGNLPDIGLTPKAQPYASVASGLTNIFNSELLTLLAATEAADAGLDLDILDLYGLMNSAVADPSAYGFSDATHACYDGAVGASGGTICATPDSYLFWDAFHPSAAAHGLIADAALRAVPEPAALALVGIALMAMTRVRARRSTGAAATP